MYLDKDKIKESLTDFDVSEILKHLGSTEGKKSIDNKYIAFQTVCHCGAKQKLYYYNDVKFFHCYTDCQDSFDIYELLIRANRARGIEISFNEAVKLVSSITGKTFTLTNAIKESHIIDDWNWIRKYQMKEKQRVSLPIRNPLVLGVFRKLPHESWIEEGISSDTIHKFNIGYYIREDRISIPHYDVDGNLIGIRGRAMLDKDIEAGKKYLPLIIENKLYNHPTMFNLYGLNKSKNAIKRLRKAIVFEGEKSVLKCEDYYGDDNFSVATCGGYISKYQMKMLLSLGIEEFIYAPDKQFYDHNSEMAYEFAKTVLKQVLKFAPYVRTYVLWDEKSLLDYRDSPADKGKEVLEQLMKDKKEVST
ncbi:hypothetical protein [Brevibacillus laterosporus]|uniref:DNA primase n=1 Tax=Brevibacillus laterosporus TaxID=1465 RepID=A0AAP8QGZ7_BRELA|nr:hypothetical protein [Brevibacillus laterosporus]PPB12933.1 hypothetical protein C4A77_00675 [Brevibacillus laterosporus]